VPRLLVIGGSGLVGTNFVLAARDKWETWATFCDHRVDFEGYVRVLGGWLGGPRDS